jgi:hypothetical protein
MTQSGKKDYSPKLKGRKLEVYGQIMAQERKALFVTEERLKWILENYPPEQEWGRKAGQ